jgi:hypothetical protein
LQKRHKVRQFFIIRDDNREHICSFVRTRPVGDTVRLDDPKKSRDQEEKYHAMIGDIAKTFKFTGETGWSEEDVKRILVDAFCRLMAEMGTPVQGHGRVVPSLDGKGIVQLGAQTRKFRVREASEFIEYLMSYGTENGVVWSDKSGIRPDLLTAK